MKKRSAEEVREMILETFERADRPLHVSELQERLESLFNLRISKSSISGHLGVLNKTTRALCFTRIAYKRTVYGQNEYFQRKAYWYLGSKFTRKEILAMKREREQKALSKTYRPPRKTQQYTFEFMEKRNAE